MPSKRWKRWAPLAVAMLVVAVWWLRPATEPGPAPATQAQRSPTPTVSPAPAPASTSVQVAGVIENRAPTTTRLWGEPGPASGEKLAVSTRLKARLSGASIPGRTASLDSALGPTLAALQRGDTVVIPLLDGEQVTGRVNLVQQDGGGIVVGGGLTGSRTGSFSLGTGGQQAGGTILLPNEDLAYTITERGEGRLVLQEKPLAELICRRLPRPAYELTGAARTPAAVTVPPMLSSRPQAVAVLYLDFDGETVTEPFWNNGNTIVAQPAALSSAQITQIWERVKEDYAPFNLDVTTDPSRYSNAPVGQRMRCIITPTDDASPDSGGVACVYSFTLAGRNGLTATIPCWVFNTSVKGISEAISHEVGHTFGLLHDGDASQPAGTAEREYYAGHGSGAVSWAPIMGSGYDAQLVQWSKGEYADANNQEDDLAIIASAANGLVTDEAGNSWGTAAALSVTNGLVNQAGIISAASDSDFYVFTITAPATVSLTASPAAGSPNLDILLELQASTGAVLVSANPDLALNASASCVATAGTYYVKIQGTGRGSVLGNGYSSYGSLGHYSLTGSVTTIIAPTITTPPASLTVTAGQSANFTVTATGTGPLDYQWRQAAIAISGATNATYNLNSAQTGDAGDYTVVVSNPAGAITSAPPAVLTVNPVPPGMVVAWGYNNLGQTTVPAAALSGVIAIAGGGFHTLALKNNGTLLAWGENRASLASVPVAAQSGVKAIATGFDHAAALKQDGSVVAWGSNTFGQVTVPLTALSGVAAIAAGGDNTAALTASGAVVVWGNNSFGQTTVPPAAQSGVTAIAAGDYHLVALKADGSVIAWGYNDFGQATVPVAAQSGVTAIAAGGNHTVALKNDGSVIAWGYNVFGQTTVPDEAQSGVTAIAAGEYHTLALKTNGLVLVWGNNTHGQRTVPMAAQFGVTAIAAGVFHSVALIGAAPPLAPAITQPPASLLAVAGTSVTFSVNASGHPAPAYQWLHTGTNLTGATNASLVLAGVTASQGGPYTVAVSNLAGAVTSTPPAVLTVVSSLFQPPVAQSAAAIRDQGFGLNLLLETGRAFRVQFKQSVEDAQWTDLTNFTSSGMAFQFLDAAATNQTRRFYRVVSP